MSNMYGYNDYNGPLTTNNDGNESVVDYEEEDDDDPLRVGQWMEGDSLAPPCGTSVPTIHKLLEFASVSEKDVVYDLGCGDGRVCLEALVHFQAKNCVGVEVEQDLVERFQTLVDETLSKIANDHDKINNNIHAVRADLREVLNHLVAIAESNNEAIDEKFQHLPTPTVLVLYLLPESIRELESDLLKLISGLDDFRIICNTWGLQTVKPSKVLEVTEPNAVASTVFRLYDKTCSR
jgi:SAM-dependent methyltransferase